MYSLLAISGCARNGTLYATGLYLPPTQDLSAVVLVARFTDLGEVRWQVIRRVQMLALQQHSIRRILLPPNTHDAGPLNPVPGQCLTVPLNERCNAGVPWIRTWDRQDTSL